MTQASVTDVQREAFEKWATSEFGYNTRRSLSDKDGYHYLSTQRAWEGWSGALSNQPKAVSVDEAENRGLRNGPALGWRLGQDDDTATFNSVSATYEHEAREMRESKRLAAIIGEGD